MAAGEVDAVIVGADRIAANGDTANKIGTYGARGAGRRTTASRSTSPRRSSTFDLATPSGADIPIEERDPAEVTRAGSHGARTRPST